MKRQRVALACAKCRSLKAKCDGRRPCCTRCAGYGFVCSWPSIRRGADRASRSEVAGAASAADDDYDMNNSQTAVDAAAGAAALTELRGGPGVAGYDVNRHGCHETYEDNGDCWTNRYSSTVSEEHGGKCTVDSPTRSLISNTPDPTKCNNDLTYVGKVSDLYFFKAVRRCIRDPTAAADASSPPLPTSPAYNEHGYDYDDYDKTPMPDHVLNSVSRRPQWPSETEARGYLDVYFSTIHVAYPFLSRVVAYEQAGRLFANKLDDKKDRSWIALLNALFSIGAYYMSFPRKEHAGIHYVFFKQSLFFSGEFMAACHLPSVWVLLVQCFFLLAVCQTDASWNMLGFAIRMGQSLGLHIDADQLGRPFSQCELRRRTWQSMFVLDRLLALQLGRPMAIHADDFVVSLPQSPAIYDDGMHELEASGPSYADYFVHVIQFSHIVESVIGGLYHPNQKEIPPARMLSSAFILDDRLARWRNSLPRHLRFDLSHTFERSSVFRRQRNMLAIKHHHLRALIFRPFLCLPILRRNDTDLMTLFEQHASQIQTAERLCVSAARKTAHLLHNVTDEQSLVHDFPWWQMISCLICASSILFVADTFLSMPPQENGDPVTLREDAETCLTVFQALSTNSEAARRAVQMLQHLQDMRAASMHATAAPSPSGPCSAQSAHARPLNILSSQSQAPLVALPTNSSILLPPYSTSDAGQDSITPTASLSLLGLPGQFDTDPWPSEISGAMEWSVRFLDLPPDLGAGEPAELG